MAAKHLFFLCAAMACAAPAWSYTCDTKSRPMSTPTERFKDNGDGTLTDSQSGLTWMRCALDQSWDGATCKGTPGGYTWQAALDAANQLNKKGGYAKHSDWRVPHIPELAMIAERQCSNPRINLTLFPATPAAPFWSATPRKGFDNDAYILSFGPEGATPGDKGEARFVRLVRGGKGTPH